MNRLYLIKKTSIYTKLKLKHLLIYVLKHYLTQHIIKQQTLSYKLRIISSKLMVILHLQSLLITLVGYGSSCINYFMPYILMNLSILLQEYML